MIGQMRVWEEMGKGWVGRGIVGWDWIRMRVFVGWKWCNMVGLCHSGVVGWDVVGRWVSLDAGMGG